MYGSSCDSSPIPCPVRWKNASPYPAAVIGSRAAASMDSARHPRPDRGAGGLLGVEQHLVVGGELGGRLADRVGPGAVRAVARGHGAADVHDHGVAGGQDPVRHLVMRAGGVRSRGHDHEVHGGVALGQDGLGDDRADLPFGQPGPQPAGDARVHPVDGLARLAQRGDLGGSLPDPQRTQGAAGQRLAHAGQRVTEPQHEQRPHPVGQADRRDAPEQAGDQAERVVGLLPRDDLQAERAGRRGLRGGQLQARHEQGRVAVRRDGQAGQAFQLLGVVAGDVAQVRAGRQQHGVQAGCAHGLAHEFKTAGGVQFHAPNPKTAPRR